MKKFLCDSSGNRFLLGQFNPTPHINEFCLLRIHHPLSPYTPDAIFVMNPAHNLVPLPLSIYAGLPFYSIKKINYRTATLNIVDIVIFPGMA